MPKDYCTFCIRTKVYVCMCACVCVCVCVHVVVCGTYLHVQVEAKDWWVVSLSLLSTLYWGRISHLNTEITDSCSLSVQLALGVPYLHFPSGRIAGRSTLAWHLCEYRDLNFGPHTCMANTLPTEVCCPLKWRRDCFLSLGINGLELKFEVHGSLLC